MTDAPERIWIGTSQDIAEFELETERNQSDYSTWQFGPYQHEYIRANLCAVPEDVQGLILTAFALLNQFKGLMADSEYEWLKATRPEVQDWLDSLPKEADHGRD